jgi:hypothetical protein
MDYVQVINKNSFAVKGRYGGIDYLFRPNTGVKVELEACKHMFAWNQTDKGGALNRLGLLKLNGSLQEAQAALDRFQFLEGKTVFPGDEIGGPAGALPTSPGGEPEANPSGPLPDKRPPGRPRKV